MATTNPDSLQSDSPLPAEVFCFGMILPATLLIVERMPELNFAADLEQVTEDVYDDAAIIATVLRGWGVRSALAGTALGDDDAGRRAVRALRELGVQGDFPTTTEYATPYELVVSDAQGNRTYFWKKDEKVLATLDAADLSPIRDASMVYVDWYDGHRIARAMDEAARHDVPVFLNVEHAHTEANVLELVSRAAICQGVTDATQEGDDPDGVADVLLDAGAGTAIVTLAKGGCLVAEAGRRLRVHAPIIRAVDACGAGATFSSGFILGRIRGWDLETSARFAVAAASLKCTVVGPRAFDEDEVQRLARSLSVEEGPVRR
jgi:sugar/nucleoside kinase (ribokinase family)